ncbi:hypothetical protein TrST_g11269 [Triparma strigata]|uniref:Protein kinase domain-containing protein n=1 Tax=Triparma strigata TaxID=1606541 RepID=A0A9W7E279_9STRA|nr:hypothetical protein TrST_g11269 [Triparma strigata]
MATIHPTSVPLHSPPSPTPDNKGTTSPPSGTPTPSGTPLDSSSQTPSSSPQTSPRCQTSDHPNAEQGYILYEYFNLRARSLGLRMLGPACLLLGCIHYYLLLSFKWGLDGPGLTSRFLPFSTIMFGVLGLVLWLPMLRRMVNDNNSYSWFGSIDKKTRIFIQILYQCFIIFATIGLQGSISDYYILIYAACLFLLYDSMNGFRRELRVLNMIVFFSLIFISHRVASKLNRQATKTYRLDLLQGISEQWVDLASEVEMFEDLGFDYAIGSGAHVNATLAQMYYSKSKKEKKNFVCNLYADVYRATSVVLASTGEIPALDFVFMNITRAMTNRSTYLEGDKWDIVKALAGFEGPVGFNLEDSASFRNFREMTGYSVEDTVLLDSDPKFYLEIDEYIYTVCKKKYNLIHGGDWVANVRFLSRSPLRDSADPSMSIPGISMVLLFTLGVILLNDEFQKIFFRTTFQIEPPRCGIFFYTVTVPLDALKRILSHFPFQRARQTLATVNSTLDSSSTSVHVHGPLDDPEESEVSFISSADVPEGSLTETSLSPKRGSSTAPQEPAATRTNLDSVIEEEQTGKGRVSRNSRRPSFGLFAASKYMITDVESAPPPGVRPGAKPSYNPNFPAMFAGHSQSPYTALEERRLKGLIDTLVTPAKYWVRIPTKANLSIFNLTRVPISVVQGALVKYKYSGGAIGFVSAPLVHTASFIWDFNTQYRQKLNMKNDLVREVTLSDSDHSYKVLNRKWLPTPFYPRDFYTTFNWKRLDQKRVAIFCYDNSNEDYDEMLRAMGRRNPPVNSSKVVKGGNTTIMLLEEIEKGEEMFTKISMVSVIDVGGLLPGWLLKQRRELFFTLIGETAYYFSEVKLTMSASSFSSLPFMNHVTSSQIVKLGPLQRGIDLDGKKESFPANIAEEKSVAVDQENSKKRIPLPNTYTKGVGLEPVHTIEAAYQYEDDHLSTLSRDGLDESDILSDSGESKNSDSNNQAFASSFFGVKKKPKQISFVKYIHSLSRKMVGQLGFEGILADDAVEFGGGNANRNLHLINPFEKPYNNPEMSGSKLRTPYFVDIFLQRATYEGKYEGSQSEEQQGRFPSAFACADEEYTQFKYFVVSQKVKTRMRPVLLFVLATTVVMVTCFVSYSDLLSGEVWYLVDVLLPIIFMTGVLVVPLTLLTSHLSDSSQFIKAQTQSMSIVGDKQSNKGFEQARYRMMSSSNYAKEILVTMAFLTSLFFLIMHFKAGQLWKSHVVRANPSETEPTLSEDDFFSVQCMYFMLFTAPVWILIFVIEPLYQFLPTKLKSMCLGVLFLTATGTMLPLDGILLVDNAIPVDFIASVFVVIVSLLLCDINLLRAFSLRVNFSLFWNTHYNKFLHSSANVHEVKSSWKTKQNFTVLETILSKRRHLLHKKLAKSLDAQELEYLNHIGKGSSANVYVAKYRDNIVAVKELDPSVTDVGQMAKFLVEMELMANLQHPNILRFEGMVLSCPKLCMVVEYAKEGSLKDVLRRNLFLDWRNEKRNLAYCVASGMEYLHSLNQPVLHKDLKSTNVLVTEWRGVKISDFGESGVCREGYASGSSPGHGQYDLVGTRLFMAPEVFKGEKYTKECDVYSFGCVLADIALSGKFEDLFWRSGKEMFGGSLEKSIASGWRPEIPKNWKNDFPIIYSLINSCWEGKPELRPTFNQIAISLDAWNGELNQKNVIESDFVLREVTEATDEENSIISQGIKNIFDKIRVRNEINILRFDVTNPKAEGTFTRRINFPAWEVCELAFDWLHPEKMRRAWMAGDLVRKTLYRVNEHHHICAFRWGHSIAGVNIASRDFVFHNIWQEISQGNYIVQYVSCDYPWQHNPQQKKTIRAFCTATLWIQQSFDGNGCFCSFTTAAKLNGVLKNAKLSMKRELEAITQYLEFLQSALKRKAQGKWAKYKDPNFVDPFYTRNGDRIPNPVPQALEDLEVDEDAENQQKETLQNTRFIQGPIMQGPLKDF